tara:strand:+ start:1256 stop:1702 length:447 start_codon:yes stop_codon:yes gene_type:complete
MFKIVTSFLIILFVFTNIYADEYFLTLRNEKVNLRQGPSFEYPIKLFYKKKFLPLLVQDEFENFRKVRDHENNTGWVHISQLSKKKAAIIIDDNSYIYSSKTIYSKPLAVSKSGKLLLIKKCKDGWCKISDRKITGWVKLKHLWGKTK